MRNHYYEPQFDMRGVKRRFDEPRPLPGIDLNVEEQLQTCRRMEFGGELADLPQEQPQDPGYYLNNTTFGSGDAEFWYQLIRLVKPRRIIEIGSGNSTLMAMRAISRNGAEDPDYQCEHTCIEPYEMPWLEGTGVTILRQKVESLDVSFFEELSENDILFIDSSHMIRPEGDVLFEYQEILPMLKPGVIVHIHDIFTPRNYPASWLATEMRLWNEQYLLEAFLCQNSDWRVLGALNFLQNEHHEALKSVCPYLTRDRQPASFYIQRAPAPQP